MMPNGTACLCCFCLEHAVIPPGIRTRRIAKPNGMQYILLDFDEIIPIEQMDELELFLGYNSLSRHVLRAFLIVLKSIGSVRKVFIL